MITVIKLGHDQSRYRVRMEWGPTGAASVPADYAVIVDVLSFTTTLTIALEQGIEVFPYRWKDARAAEHAVRHGATLAVGRFEVVSRGGPRHVSLSPASMAEVTGLERLVLPSPNGSTIAFGMAESGAQVVGACLRNASAVARWLTPKIAGGASVVIVPAGERWDDDTLRPAVEDLWGAGAVLSALIGDGDNGVDRSVVSPEAAMSVAAWQGATLPDDLMGCASGLELVEWGFASDVEISSRHDVSSVVPVLVGESFLDSESIEERPPLPRLRPVES